MIPTEIVDCYRLARRQHDRWRRAWQAEWPSCQHAPRAWTRTGVLRKARRRAYRQPEPVGLLDGRDW